jgi:hypothetical protein
VHSTRRRVEMEYSANMQTYKSRVSSSLTTSTPDALSTSTSSLYSAFRFLVIKILYSVTACASSRYWWWAGRKLCSSSSCEGRLRCRGFRGNEISEVCQVSFARPAAFRSVISLEFSCTGLFPLRVAAIPLTITHAFVFLLANRYHVGESLIPSIRHYMRFIGAEEKVANHGFVRKVRTIPVNPILMPSHSTRSLGQRLNSTSTNEKDVSPILSFCSKLRLLVSMFQIQTS